MWMAGGVVGSVDGRPVSIRIDSVVKGQPRRGDEARRIRAREDAGAWAVGGRGDRDDEGQCGRVGSARSHRRRRAAQRESVREG